MKLLSRLHSSRSAFLRRPGALLALALCPVLPAAAQQPKSTPPSSQASQPAPAQLSDWTKLIDANKCEAARQLCSPYIHAPQIGQQVEAQKCLANVALCGHDVVMLQGDNNGGGTISGSYTAAAVDESLAHLNTALKLAPQDLSIHLGRLHVLEISGRYDAMVAALNQSCSIYEGKDVPDAWLAYAPELEDLEQYQTAVAFMKVLNQHYPNSSDILGNIGAFLLMENKSAEGIPYLQQAVKLAPTDPINTWDLARSYDYAGQTALADQWYQKALPLAADKDEKAQYNCMYGQFVEQKLHDRSRACTLEMQGCAAKDQTACQPPKTVASPAPAKR